MHTYCKLRHRYVHKMNTNITTLYCGAKGALKVSPQLSFIGDSQQIILLQISL